MADIANKTENSGPIDSIDTRSIDEMVLESLPVPDRLPPMLFLAALIHGILIIGVTFNAVLGDEFKDAIIARGHHRGRSGQQRAGSGPG